MAKFVSREGGRTARRSLEPIIVTRRGKIARQESSLTPNEAQIEDLVFLRKALTRENIPFLLLRNHKGRPVLAVDIELRAAVQQALAKACATEPMYAKTIDEKAFLPSSSPRAGYPSWLIPVSCGCIGGGSRPGV